jgi:hypothetical protein
LFNTVAEMKRGRFTISKATTHLSEPVDSDGYLDYVAALNERLSKGVTPENNANVLIWNTLGPNPTGTRIPPVFFEKLGIPAPPPEGEYYVALSHCFKQRASSLPLRLFNRLKGLFTRVSSAAEVDLDSMSRFCWQPWTMKDNRPLGLWLERNEKPLAQLASATTRTHYHWPIVRDTEGKTAGLLLLPEIHVLHEVAWAFATRAMLHLGHGNAGAAWQELLTCHRLGRLLFVRGGTLMEVLVGLAVEQIAYQGHLAFLAHSKPDARMIEACMCDLRALPSFPDLADKIDLGERLFSLDSFMQIDRVGISILSKMWDLELWRCAEHGFSDDFLNGIDWNPGLEALNTWYDRMVAAFREEDRTTRNHELAQIESQVLKLKSQFDGELWAELKNASVSPALRGHIVGYWSLSLSLTAFQKVRIAADRIAQMYINTIVAFALARYHFDSGGYPERLDSLVPHYLKEVPRDIFTGHSLIYRSAPNCYLLYGVGPNERDDGGHGPNDQPPGDDIAVRMPFPREQ